MPPAVSYIFAVGRRSSHSVRQVPEEMERVGHVRFLQLGIRSTKERVGCQCVVVGGGGWERGVTSSDFATIIERGDFVTLMMVGKLAV